MDAEIMDFFDFTKDFRREEAPSGFISSDPSSMATEMFESKPIKREVIGTDYVAEIAAKEKLLMSGVRSSVGIYFCLFLTFDSFLIATESRDSRPIQWRHG